MNLCTELFGHSGGWTRSSLLASLYDTGLHRATSLDSTFCHESSSTQYTHAYTHVHGRNSTPIPIPTDAIIHPPPHPCKFADMGRTHTHTRGFSSRWVYTHTYTRLKNRGGPRLCSGRPMYHCRVTRIHLIELHNNCVHDGPQNYPQRTIVPPRSSTAQIRPRRKH